MMRPFDRRPFPANRRFVTAAMRSGRRMAPMTGLVRADVTESWDWITERGASPTAFFAACLGRAVAAHPEVHAYRDWLGRLVIHRHVDITTMVEVDSVSGKYPLAVPLLECERRSVAEITAELRRVKDRPASKGSGRLLLKWGTAAGRIPGLARLGFFIAARSPAARSRMGTVSLSSVGMLTDGGGFVMGVPTISSVLLLVGAATEQPWVVDGEIVVRRIVDLTVQIDHNVVDGAPASRFGARLRKLIEDPELVDW